MICEADFDDVSLKPIELLHPYISPTYVYPMLLTYIIISQMFSQAIEIWLK